MSLEVEPFLVHLEVTCGLSPLPAHPQHRLTAHLLWVGSAPIIWPDPGPHKAQEIHAANHTPPSPTPSCVQVKCLLCWTEEG